MLTPFKTQLEASFRNFREELRRQWEADIQEAVGNALRGGKVQAALLAGTIPTASLPAHSHEGGGGAALYVAEIDGTPEAGSVTYIKVSNGRLTNDGGGTVTLDISGTASGGYTQGARVYHSTSQSINNATLTALAMDTEAYDTESIHDTVTNNTRLTCQTAGKYLIIGHYIWNPNATGRRFVTIMLNGTTDIAQAEMVPEDTTNYPSLVVSTIYSLAVNDYVELMAFQSSGGALSVYYASGRSPAFMMQRIG